MSLKTGFITEVHPITSLSSAFDLDGAAFRIFLKRKSQEEATVITVNGKQFNNPTAVACPVIADQWSDVLFTSLEATSIDTTKYDVYFGVKNKTAFTVSFDANGGTMPDNTSQILMWGQKATQPTKKPIKANHYFKAWNLGESAYDFDTVVTSNITLQADFKEYFDVIFDTKGGNSIATQKVYDGAKAIAPSNPTREGYTFNEWTVGGETFSFDTEITSTTAIVASWLEKFTVTFNSDGGSAVASQEITDGLTATEPTPAPTKDGFTFQHWSTTIDGLAFNFATPITEDTLLYAIWA
mgnify:CR=1 FL=1